MVAVVKADECEEAVRRVALKYKLSRFVQGDDTYGGEDVPYANAIEALREIWAKAAAEERRACATLIRNGVHKLYTFDEYIHLTELAAAIEARSMASL